MSIRTWYNICSAWFLITCIRIYQLALYRCIADEQRSLALGLQSVFFRALGSIPGPLIFGALFDASCVYWQEECGDRGNCWVYDNEDMSLRVFGVSMGVRIVSVIFALCTWIFYDVTLCNRGQVTDEAEMKDIERTWYLWAILVLIYIFMYFLYLYCNYSQLTN